MIKVGISQCLTGANVRYDGGHRNSKFCNQELADIFSFTPLCPEIGIGLPIPRKTIRLIGDIGSPRAVFSDDSSIDLTDKLTNFADANLDKLSDMSGFVFCKASPSCGTQRVKVYNDKGHSESKGMGVFAARVHALFPDLPFEDDGRLNDPLIRDSFIKRVFIYDEWRAMLKSGISAKKLYKFHAKHKFTLLSHCQPTYRMIGPLVASANKNDVQEIAKSYISLMMKGLTQVATRKNNTNVLMHLQGYLKHVLDSQDKQELRQCIFDYKLGEAPILSPLTLIKHHFKRNPNPYIDQQSYLNPYPKQLGIRVLMR
jgi:uncharacterized protein YbgA (DUF1722 family)/uncharacterized protein YbbK (DUF523 family)